VNKTNLFIDAGIFAAFLIAMEPRLSGIPVHEWLSVALAGTIVVHLLLHWKWIIGVAARFFQKLWHTSRLKFAVDALLFVDFIAVMLSGVMISRAVIPYLGLSIAQGSMVWRTLHTLTANYGIWLVALHFALNWDWVVGTVKRTLITPIARLFAPKPVAAVVPVRNDESITR
jgi:hypothetical protein